MLKHYSSIFKVLQRPTNGICLIVPQHYLIRDTVLRQLYCLLSTLRLVRKLSRPFCSDGNNSSNNNLLLFLSSPLCWDIIYFLHSSSYDAMFRISNENSSGNTPVFKLLISSHKYLTLSKYSVPALLCLSLWLLPTFTYLLGNPFHNANYFPLSRHAITMYSQN